MPDLSDSATERIAQQLAVELTKHKQAHWVESELHYQDHQWIKDRREYEKEHKIVKSKIIQSAIVWALIIIMGFLVKTVWKAFITTVKTGL